MGCVGVFLTRVAAASVSLALTLTLLTPAGSGVGTDSGTARAASRYLNRDVYAALNAHTIANDTTQSIVYLTGIDGNNSKSAAISHMSADTEALPWHVQVTYSLDGPQTDAATINGAHGLVGVHVTVTRDELTSTDIANIADNLVPVLAFTIPTDAGSDLTASDGVTITQHGSDTVIAAVGNARGDTVDGSGAAHTDVADSTDNAHATRDKAVANATNAFTSDLATVLDFGVYLNATHFSMSPIVFAAVPASDADSLNTQLSDLTAGATSLANDMSGAGNHQYDDLIAQLTALRESERALAESTISERSAAHKRAFDAYMAAYVGSYTTHLRGSISTKTQMSALIGTAGELSGDTPLAQAVVDLANAVNAVSAAHRHTGAADEVDTIIRRIRQQGTNGLIDELKQAAGHESQLGSSGYSAGQAQLSQAMIPYSMAYTDTYTEHLSELTGGTSSGAAAYQAQAIEQTNASFQSSDDLKADQAKVDAAMAALATASEHTGRAQAIEQLLLRFEDQFEAGESSSDASSASRKSVANPLRSLSESSSPTLGVGGNGIAAVVEAARLKQLRAAREQAAARAQQQTSHDGQSASLVDDQIAMSKDDVMSFAGAVGSISGGESSGGSDGAAGSDNSDNANSNSDGDTDAQGGGKSKTGTVSVIDTPSVAFGMQGMHPGTLLTASNATTVNATTTLSDGADILSVAVPALRDAGALNDLSQRTTLTLPATNDAMSRFLLVYQTVQ
ncbi:hypothetical protein BHAP_0517 [Bifidobacterium hapali]|uniref:Tubuliform spidroin n=1 Tax=Bifidobacterium hapali TaxID=1630172 RepID=A0A261G2Q2_9BIFI|nr:hypothetical protein [Bifidobacterium hapali]OZG65714.1 hypothetical protein BHAP_0517 [Bifidobacterium hapali]